MSLNLPERNIGNYTVRLMKDADAEGVIALYRSVYGENYPIREMYDAAHIIRQQKAGLMYRVVVVDQSGKVLAHEAIYRLEETYKGTYEGGHAMVMKDYRGEGFHDAMVLYIGQDLVPAAGVEELWGEAVANQIYTQKSAVKGGYRETGIEIELMPSDSYEMEKSAKGRVSSVVAGFPFREKLHTVFLPSIYSEIMTGIYGHTKRDRNLEISGQPLPEGVTTRYADTFIEAAGVLRVTILEAGNDADNVIAGLMQKYIPAGAVVLQVLLPLEKTWSGALTDILNRHGFFFSAIMPRWFDTDGLLLQKLLMEPDYDSIVIYADFTRKLLDFIKDDRIRVLSGGNKQ